MSTQPLTARLATPTVLLYAAGYPIGSAAVTVMSPFLVVALRFAASAVFVWIIVIARGTVLPGWRMIGHAVVAGLMTQATQFLGVYWALSRGVSSGLASLVIALNPVVTAAIIWMVFRRRESRQGVIALALAVCAVVLACTPKLIEDHSVGAGVIAAVVAVVGLSAGGIYQSSKCADLDVWLITAIGLTASAPVAALMASISPATTTDWPQAIALLAIMVVFTSIGATTLYAACIKRAGARAASILFAVIPAAATLMAWIALDEAVSVLTFAGLFLGAAACIAQGQAGTHGKPSRTVMNSPGSSRSTTTSSSGGEV